MQARTPWPSSPGFRAAPPVESSPRPWARTSLTEALPSAQSLFPGGLTGSGASTGVSGGITPVAPAGAPPLATTIVRGVQSGPVDPELTAEFTERRARAAVLKVEGPRMLQAGNWRRAAELCRAWTVLDFANADAWRCLGQALQAQGYHQDAINAFRKAKQYDPDDRTLDAAIDRSQKGIVAEFLNRHRR